MEPLTEGVVLTLLAICFVVIVVMIGLPLLFIILLALMHKWGIY